MDTDQELMALLEGARAGRAQALERLLYRLRPWINRYLRSRLSSQPASRWLADELTQEVLIKLDDALEQCRADSPAAFRAWVRTTARRTATDWYRRREEALERRPLRSDRARKETWYRASADEEEPDVLQEEIPAVDRALGRLLMRAQDALSEGTRQVVRRKLLLEETWAETGEAVGTTGGGAKRRWQRAEDRLHREILEQAAALPEGLRRKVLERLGVK